MSSTVRHRILLTGSSGTLGSHVLDRLIARDDVEVLTFGRNERKSLSPLDRSRHEVIDFNDNLRVASAFLEFHPTCVIHCAGSGMIFPSLHWFDLVRFNVETTLTLFRLSTAISGCHFIHVSTGLVYREKGAPLNELDALENTHPYGASKAAADLLLRSAAREFGSSLTLFRPFSFTGARDNTTRLFPSILRAASEAKEAALSPCDQVRDFCSADDIACGIVKTVGRPPPPGIPAPYNLGSGQSLTLRRTIEAVVAQLRLSVNLKFGARSYGPSEPMHLVADIGRAQRELSWNPRHNLAHAVWQLAAESFPTLELSEPEKYLATT